MVSIHLGPLQTSGGNLGLLLHHSGIDSPALATAYDTNLHTELSNLARERARNIDYTAALSEEKYDIERYVLANLTPKGNGKEKGQKGGKGEKNNHNRQTGSVQAGPNTHSIADSASSGPQPRQQVKKKQPSQSVAKEGAPSIDKDRTDPEIAHMGVP